MICAPLSIEGVNYGLIHLYSTNPENPLDPEDLEFTLAVADQMALVLEQLRQRDQLAVGLERVRNENQTLREQLRQETELVGQSDSIVNLQERIQRIAPTDATVLIRGESGVGKELVARAIHNHSSRPTGPFVTMNCAALSETLLESELFGHEKGAFTGATGKKIGKFEQADGGTIFLDEVGEMSPAIQAKFLRVLEGHRLRTGRRRRVGQGRCAGRRGHQSRSRSNAVKAGTFRKDLYFRLQVVELHVEPLRDRKTDIPILAQHFLERFAHKIGRQPPSCRPSASTALTDYHWPGNVRELQNTIERAVILSVTETLDSQDIQFSALGRSDPHAASPSQDSFQPIPLDVIEQQHILATLDSTNWNKSQAAQLLGIERSTLDRKLKRYEADRQLAEKSPRTGSGH